MSWPIFLALQAEIMAVAWVASHRSFFWWLSIMLVIASIIAQGGRIWQQTRKKTKPSVNSENRP